MVIFLRYDVQPLEGVKWHSLYHNTQVCHLIQIHDKQQGKEHTLY